MIKLTENELIKAYADVEGAEVRIYERLARLSDVEIADDPQCREDLEAFAEALSRALAGIAGRISRIMESRQ